MKTGDVKTHRSGRWKRGEKMAEFERGGGRVEKLFRSFTRAKVGLHHHKNAQLGHK